MRFVYLFSTASVDLGLAFPMVIRNTIRALGDGSSKERLPARVIGERPVYAAVSKTPAHGPSAIVIIVTNLFC